MATSTSSSSASSTSNQNGDPTNPGSGTTSWEADFRWLVAWLVLLLILWAISRTSVGRVVIYYVLALSLLFLLVTQYRFIAQALAPFGQLGPGLSSDTPDTATVQGGTNA